MRILFINEVLGKKERREEKPYKNRSHKLGYHPGGGKNEKNHKITIKK